MEPENKEIKLLGRGMDLVRVDGSVVSGFYLSNDKVKELGCFSTDFDGIWFFEGSIKELSIDACTVGKFTYAGYDINKLIEIAGQHPELFKKDGSDSAERQVKKASIDDVTVRLLTAKDLSEGHHPCVINDCRIDKNSKLHKASAEEFGGWGYEATCKSQVCGFMGIMPKDISYRDAGFLPPSELPNEAVLLLTCYAGGGVFGPQFNRIGIAKKMIGQAISDAKSKGYLRIEAYAHPEVVPVLEKCGFTRVEWETDKDSPQAFYKLDLTVGEETK
jgi:GNAT superfamily N-acetyltransferase